MVDGCWREVGESQELPRRRKWDNNDVVSVNVPGQSANREVASETTSETALAGRAYLMRDRAMRFARMCLQMIMAVAQARIAVREMTKALAQN
jgi:hypothetical protein